MSLDPIQPPDVGPLRETARTTPLVLPAEPTLLDSVLSIGRVVWSRKRGMVVAGLVGGLLAGAATLIKPDLYTAHATLMPLASDDSFMASLRGSGLGPMVTPTSDRLLAVLSSRTLAENVVRKFGLAGKLTRSGGVTPFDRLVGALALDRGLSKVRDANAELTERIESSPLAGRQLQETVRRLQAHLWAQFDQSTGLIEISVEHGDAVVAADIANAYLIELGTFLQERSLTSAKRNFDFLQQQVEQVAQEMKAQEAALRDFQERNKVISLDAQAQASVQAFADLKARLVGKEMELNLLQQSASSDDMQVIGLRQEVEELRAKLNVLENGRSEGLVSFRDAPQIGMRMSQLKREVDIKQSTFEMLNKQLELARIQEAKATMTFQIIDQAIAPEDKNASHRPRVVMLGVLASMLLWLCLGLVREKVKADAELASQASLVS